LRIGFDNLANQNSRLDLRHIEIIFQSFLLRMDAELVRTLANSLPDLVYGYQVLDLAI
jgi:hypothetical protein